MKFGKEEKPRHLHGLVKNYPHSYQGFYVQLIIIAACHLPCNMANALVSQGWGGSLSNPGTFGEVGFWRGVLLDVQVFPIKRLI